VLPVVCYVVSKQTQICFVSASIFVKKALNVPKKKKNVRNDYKNYKGNIATKIVIGTGVAYRSSVLTIHFDCYV
jgi:hypothetical protein